MEALFKKIQDILVKTPIDKGRQQKPGEWIIEFLASAGIHQDNHDVLLKILDACIDLVINETHRNRKSSNELSLQVFQSALKLVFRISQEKSKEAWSSYRVYISQEQDPQTKSVERCLSLWCFSSGVAMKDFIKESCVRSILLASGTLSPLESFAVEMGIPFNVRLENSHVITKEQISVSIVGKGPGGHTLNSSYENRKSPEYIMDMGNLIVNVSRSTPEGMLVFFPSYTIMSLFVDAWQKPNVKVTFHKLTISKANQ